MKTRQSLKGLLFVSAALCVTACTTGHHKAADPSSSAAERSSASVAPANSTALMQNLSVTLARLLPTLVSTDLSRDPTKRGEVLELSTSLSETAHHLDQARSPSSGDPALKFVSRDFRVESESAVALMRAGEWEPARSKMLKVTRYCYACHSMQFSRPSGSATESGFKPDLTGLSELQRGEFFSSIRQFDQAIIHYENGLVDAKWASENGDKWNEAFKKLLAVTVRVRGSAGLTMELISRFLDSESYPADLKKTAFVWRQHAKEWRLERKTKKVDALVQARSLINRAKGLRAPAGGGKGLVLFLRASGLLHSYLGVPENTANQEAIYLAGQAAEGLAELNFWTFPEDYYSSCVNVNPSSDWSRRCQEELRKLTQGSVVSRSTAAQKDR